MCRFQRLSRLSGVFRLGRKHISIRRGFQQHGSPNRDLHRGAGRQSNLSRRAPALPALWRVQCSLIHTLVDGDVIVENVAEPQRQDLTWT